MTIMQKAYWLMLTLGNLITFLLWQYHADDLTFILFVFSLIYSVIGFYDVFFSKRNLNRLYPVVAYIRYFLESFRVEIQQYFIANDTEEKPLIASSAL